MVEMAVTNITYSQSHYWALAGFDYQQEKNIKEWVIKHQPT